MFDTYLYQYNTKWRTKKWMIKIEERKPEWPSNLWAGSQSRKRACGEGGIFLGWLLGEFCIFILDSYQWFGDKWKALCVSSYTSLSVLMEVNFDWRRMSYLNMSTIYLSDVFWLIWPNPVYLFSAIFPAFTPDWVSIGHTIDILRKILFLRRHVKFENGNTTLIFINEWRFTCFTMTQMECAEAKNWLKISLVLSVKVLRSEEA